MERRRFLTAGPALAAIASLAPAALLADSQGLDIREVAFSSGLSQAKFEKLIGQSFYVDFPGGTLLAQLVGVDPRSKVVGVEQFSVWLQSSPVPALEEGLYHLNHYLAGDLQLHLQPCGTAGLYRAEFSLLR
jgi:hypothetical protein